jgi:hypothetical protein
VSDVEELFPATPQVEYIGPLSHHEVVVNGWAVPMLEAHMLPGGQINLVLDRRYGIDLTVEEAERVVPFVADAIAIALGFAGHPQSAEAEPIRFDQPRPRRYVGLDWVQAEPS